ncbi:MAG TPA: hypothetical protein VFA59_13195 [Vicinamibacterales bacterium]|nr:hypothetical protein [Vicinamibacterales bacterium]
MTRRGFLQVAGVAAIADRTIDPVSQRASAFIRGYSAEGFHRTATDVDRASATRLLQFVRDAGAHGRLEPFQLSRVDPGTAFLQIGDRRLTGLPMFDAPFTDGDGIRGVIGGVDGADPIGWTRIAPNGEAQLRRMRQASPHRAIVAVTAGGRPGLCPVNAQYFNEPFGPPVLQLSSEHVDTVADAARRAADVWVVAPAQRRRMSAQNVVVDIEGTRPDLPPLCVMTPRSGWHSNAAERGGGLACWLEVLGAAAAARPRPRRTIRLVASSGHELGHLGLHDYLARRPSLARDSYVWLHFGANIGATRGTVTATCSDTMFEELVARSFAEGSAPRINTAEPDRVAGEAATIREQGGRFISFIGTNEWFHNPLDRWPDAVDVADLSRFARASVALAMTLANRLS